MSKFLFLSTLSLRRATACLPACFVGASISIHALLAESDSPHGKKHINSRTFLSTLSLRRATVKANTGEHLEIIFLSTLSLRRATILGRVEVVQLTLFLSTLSLRRATRCFSASQNPSGFLSTLSLRRATQPDKLNKLVGLISIHALLAESDGTSSR